MGPHEADQPPVLEPNQPRLFIVDDAGRVVAEGRIVFPVVAPVIRPHQCRARAFALALFAVTPDAAVQPQQQPAVRQFPAAAAAAAVLQWPHVDRNG